MIENIDFSVFEQDVLNAIQTSAQIANSINCNYVTLCHLMGGIMSTNSNIACSILNSQGYDINRSMENVAHKISTEIISNGQSGVQFTPEVLNIFSKAVNNNQHVNLTALTKELIKHNELKQILVKNTPENPTIDEESAIHDHGYVCHTSATGETIVKHCLNMLEMASKGKYKHAIGRDEEVERVFLILARSSKNNPVLVGEPGTGKTAIAEELALRLYKRQVPPDLQSLKLYSLDFTSIKALPDSTKIMKSILDEAIEDPDMILFIDEIHMLISNCNCSDNDIANLLKPAMARGNIKIFGATTIDEYKRIEKDPAFERRFQKIIVDEPDIESAIHIVTSSKSHYEDFHHINIPDEVCKAAVTLTDRYITNRKLPDKAFDVIDEACANVRIIDKENRPLSINDIREVITDWTDIPIEEVDENEAVKLQKIEEILMASVVGQDKAVKAVSDAIRRNRMGFCDESKPIGSFLFLGTTGTGKTELCKAVAKFLFNDSDMMIRIDMSEYQQEHSVARLFGAPPGYVGYDQGGQLTEAVKRKPFSVVLFDEIEKAHPKIFETLLQVLDDGRMTDGQGKTIDFKNTLIVMTSNIGQQHILSSLLHKPQISDYDLEICSQEVVKTLKTKVAPEFINRIDNIIMFSPLGKQDLAKIAKINIKKEQTKLKNKEISLSVDSKAIEYIVDKGYNPEYGGRPVKRAITEYIINPLTSAIINGTIDKKRPINTTVINNQIVFSNGITREF